MKKLTFRNTIILFLILAVFSMAAFGCSNKSTPGANTKPNIFTVNYMTSEGGYISSGNRAQTIERGKSGTEVIVTPNEGYVFVNWSDGLTATTRRETNVQSNLNLTATFSKISLSLTYTAGFGGEIVGEKEQNVKYGENPTSVTAKPNDGFLFAGWSDGVMSDTRQDRTIKNDIAVNAKFVIKTKTFAYSYNNATANNTQKNITLSYDTLAGTTFAVPTRERFSFSGWYLEPTFKTKVADENGMLFLGNGVFFSASDNLYAKWTASETYTYKILMVFVDEVHAKLKTADGEMIDVDYKMSLIERKICELIPPQVSKYLNEWFEGQVNFEIDTYFTTVPLGSDSFDSGTSSSGKFCYRASAPDMTEIGQLQKNYRSVITTFSLNDYDYLLHNSAGSATQKYATVSMETLIYPLILNNIPLESYFDLSYEAWEVAIYVYLHEFAHTVEQGLDVYEYHEVESYYVNKSVEEIGFWNTETVLIATKLYLLNQAIVNGETVGIPFEFWKGEIDVRVSYQPSYFGGWDNGQIVVVGAPPSQSNNVYIKVPFGSEMTVEAIPFEGYKFSHWSDGVTTAIRHDANITSILKVMAIFVKV